MTRAVTRLFNSHSQAVDAVRDLERAGIDHKQISLLANNAEKWHDNDRVQAVGDDDDGAGEGVAAGATAGGVIGGGAGLLAGLGMLAIPGLGPVVAAGWLASTAIGVVAGAVAGGATGGVIGALTDAGHSEEEAHVYAEGVRRGGSLVSVRPGDEAEARLAETVLSDQGGIDAAHRGDAYRQSGWSRFDETAAPYNRDQIATERSRWM